MAHRFHRLSVVLPEAGAAPLAEALGDADALSVVEVQDGGPWRVEALYAERPADEPLLLALALAAAAAGLAPPTPVWDRVEERDWAADVARSFPPVQVGPFWIAGSHVPRPAPPSAIDLLIDAGTAFGSGEHPTSAGCLLMVEHLARQGQLKRPVRLLDLGCGSGILAIGALKRLPHAYAVASDLDPEAARVTRFNADRNEVGHRVQVYAANGVQSPALTGPFDLVLANILARPLRRLAPALARRVAPGGHVVLAGLLTTQTLWVETVWRAVGLYPVQRRTIGDWSILLLRKPGR